ncbi:hypothetical protein [Micromonospora sp. RTGN7]|uniref:hypothetical protein n=1 Tax=Micromonospora sp. RTGN7 TaxID=3016526 RepID=UPI0029FEDA3D|nr:hypothetical protein [Micromonospora sp. RTGN7]
MDDTTKEDLRREALQLRQQVSRLETTLLHLVSLTAASLVITGLLLPYAAFEEKGKLHNESLLTMGFTAGKTDGFYAVVFLGLLVIAGATLIFLGVAGERSAGRATERIGLVLGWLLLLSAAGEWLLASFPATNWDKGPGARVYAMGAALTFIVLATQKGRDFWVAERCGKIRH